MREKAAKSKITQRSGEVAELPGKMVKNDTKMAMGNTTMILAEFNVVK